MGSTLFGVSATSFHRFGRYVVEQELGRGGMGIVFAARDPELARRVAIKVLPPELAADPDRLDRLRREARALAALDHPNIATIHGMDEDATHGRFLVLELVPGRTVADRLEEGALGIDDTLALGIQVADALAAAHARGVVHRDIKPRNLMLGADGRVKVLDFGLARRVEVDGEAVVNAAEALAISQTEGDGGGMGTASYLSPERILGEAGDTRADLFSLGCVLHECLTGRRTFRGATRFGALAAALGAKVDWSDLPSDTPEAMRDLLVVCLQREPGGRPRSAAEVRDGLIAIQAGRGPRAVPAPATTTVHNLRDATTSLVGREAELATCEARLAPGTALTLTGLGGSGKTRLAHRLAERALHRGLDAVWWIELAPARDRDTVLALVAAALDPKERPPTPTPEALAGAFGLRSGLLVLDNCEDVRPAAAELVGALTSRCPGLEVLLTSRVPVEFPGERTHAVPPLDVPDAVPAGVNTVTGLLRVDAVRLFFERARSVEPRFALTADSAPIVIALCRRLDGMPLALELAAARLRLSSLAEIAARLESGGGPRAGGLRLALEWSVGQLTPALRDDFARLGVFVGGWTLDAARAACDLADEEEMLDRIGALVDVALVVVERGDGATRYRFLEPVRQFAVERLTALGRDEEHAVRERHLAWCLALCEAQPQSEMSEALEWRSRIVADYANTLAALDWCDHSPAGARAGLRMVGAVAAVWSDRGQGALRREQVERALRRPGAEVPSPERVRCLRLAAVGRWDARAVEQIEEALDLAVHLGDRLGEADAVTALAQRADGRRDFVEARRLYERGLQAFRDIGNKAGIARVLINLGILALRDDPLAALGMYGESIAHAREGANPIGLVMALSVRASAAIGLGRHAEARTDLIEALELTLQIRSVKAGTGTLGVTTELALKEGAGEVATCLLAASEALLGGRDGRSNVVEEEITNLRTACLQRLGDADFERAWAAGASLSFEDACRYALTWLSGVR